MSAEPPIEKIPSAEARAERLARDNGVAATSMATEIRTLRIDNARLRDEAAIRSILGDAVSPLQAAAERVCWFDSAIEALRGALAVTRPASKQPAAAPPTVAEVQAQLALPQYRSRLS